MADHEAAKRSYHNSDVEYNLPNDAAEHARLDDQAASYTALMHSCIVHAPLHNPRTLLDVGCGTGFVTRQLAEQFPSATVYGVDISPVPAFSGTPSNILYIEGDIRSLAKRDSRLAPASLDYIYSRLLICGMTDWPAYVQEMAGLLRPGGWMEVHDYAEVWFKDGEICSGDWKWQQAMREGARRKGLDLDCGRNAKGYMEGAGLTDVEVVKYVVPFGTWMVDERPETKRIGEHQARDMGPVFAESILPRVVKDLGLREEEVRELKEECRVCLKGEEGKYWEFYVTVGRKVGDGES